MPIALPRLPLWVVLALLFAHWGGQAAAEPVKPAPEAAARAGVSPLPSGEAINTRIDQVSGLKDLEAGAKTRLLDLYRKTLAAIDSAQASAQAGERFRSAAEDAPAETTRIRDALNRPAGEPAKAPPVPRPQGLLQPPKAPAAIPGPELSQAAD